LDKLPNAAKRALPAASPKMKQSFTHYVDRTSKVIIPRWIENRQDV
jgi:hypothetical protein